MVKTGDKVEVILEDKCFIGTLMPEKITTLVLKLDNGYNLGIEKTNIKAIRVVETYKKTAHKFQATSVNSSLPKISILHTGGTIASKVDYVTGAVINKISPEELLQAIPELNNIAQINSRLIGNMWSQDMRFIHYNIIAKEIQEEIKNGAQGIIITHGTDTLHYTSAALSFMLDNLSIPVLMTGSQRSSDRGSGDGAMNIINAVYFAANSDFGEVALCMHNSSSDDSCAILPASKTKKMHASRRDAFRPINSRPIAMVDYKKQKIEFNTQNYIKKSAIIPSLKLFKPDIKVGILRQFTNMNAAQFLFFKKYDGLVIETTGLGNLPITKTDEHTKEHIKIYNALKKMILNGLIVILSAQTTYGAINLNVYENERRQQDIGILGNFNDMTTETTFIKLAWLLSNYTKQETKSLILKNIKGELSGREDENTFLI